MWNTVIKWHSASVRVLTPFWRARARPTIYPLIIETSVQLSADLSLLGSCATCTQTRSPTKPTMCTLRNWVFHMTYARARITRKSPPSQARAAHFAPVHARAFAALLFQLPHKSNHCVSAPRRDTLGWLMAYRSCGSRMAARSDRIIRNTWCVHARARACHAKAHYNNLVARAYMCVSVHTIHTARWMSVITGICVIRARI